MKKSDESGSMTVLTLGFVLVVFAVLGLAVDGTRAFIDRRALQSAADAAAVSAAGEIDTSTYYRSGGAMVRLDPRTAEVMAARLLERRGIRATARLSADDRSIRVELVGQTRTTWLRIVGIEVIPVAATSRAEPFSQDLGT